MGPDTTVPLWTECKMASLEGRSTSIIPLHEQGQLSNMESTMLDGINSWGLWGIISGTETTPAEGDEHRAKLLNRKDRALAIIVLAVEPSLLYLEYKLLRITTRAVWLGQPTLFYGNTTLVKPNLSKLQCVSNSEENDHVDRNLYQSAVGLSLYTNTSWSWHPICCWQCCLVLL